MQPEQGAFRLPPPEASAAPTRVKRQKDVPEAGKLFSLNKMAAAAMLFQ